MTTGARRGHAIAWCDACEKKSYTSRKAARRIARRHTEHKTVYRCPINQMLWHVGRLAEAIRQGQVSREEFYSPEYQISLRRRGGTQ